jgi:hypothetical protein
LCGIGDEGKFFLELSRFKMKAEMLISDANLETMIF